MGVYACTMRHTGLVLSLALFWLPAMAIAEWFSDTQPIMGTRVHVEFWHDDSPKAQALLAQSMAEMQRIEWAYSPQREDSELSRLNQNGGKDWVAASDEMLDLLAKSVRMSELSGGAFDITFASVGRFYDYRQGKQPTAEEREAVEAINFRHIQIDWTARKVRFGHPQVYIDLGGIAKGYAVDRVITLLTDAGIAHGSVSAGGDSRIIGDRRGKPWSVGVRDPRDETGLTAVLPLEDTAVSTSGDYERYFEQDGVRYHHILDPQSGRSATGAMSVTILGPEAAFTDALSTSVFVLGVQAGLRLVDQIPGVDAIIIDPDGKLHYSKELERLTR